MSTLGIVLIIVAVVLVGAAVALYFLGKKAQKKQAEQQEMLNANRQSVSMLVIDKKRMKLKDSGLPQQVIESAPKMARRAKMPIVKVKVGPQIMSLVADEKIYDAIPVKKEVKAVVSGIYIMEVKGLHGRVEVAPPKKQGALKRAIERAQEKAGAKPIK